jgi:hypothetical protein
MRTGDRLPAKSSMLACPRSFFAAEILRTTRMFGLNLAYVPLSNTFTWLLALPKSMRPA